MTNGANSVHEELKRELLQYIKTQYLSKSDILLDTVGPRLNEEGILFQKPYIESSPAYKSVPNGLHKLKIDDWKIDFLSDLSSKGLGVFSSPFLHQMQALEAVENGKDLFVSTGTGSGKTECFMWPLLLKLAKEARNNTSSWEKRGVRVMIMYPMNALVSDQLSRLRRLIGDKNNDFVQVFRTHCGQETRRPQFGMYTGRTPYPGIEPDTTQDRQLEKTLSKMIRSETNPDNSFITMLEKEGKIPSKSDLHGFLKKLHNSQHFPDDEDAELITRFEMQRVTPDILITNYSMLEYMLLRPRENNIWKETKEWLFADEDNKLLFIIDEAHMYKGSAGGEVALLIRRLFEKLEINRNKVQFILTTASMPDKLPEDKEKVISFAMSLTASSDNNFCYLTGEREDIEGKQSQLIADTVYEGFNPSEFEDPDSRLEALNRFWKLAAKKEFKDLEDSYTWMYDNLVLFSPFHGLFLKCRGNAVSLNELASDLFPSLEKQKSLNAVSILLAIAPLAKNDKGAILFPARLHMLFKGINGIYACTNENCNHNHKGYKLTLGELFLTDGQISCPHCGSSVYELYNDRRCGALFYKAYVFEDELVNNNHVYLWRYPGQILDHRMKEIRLYIPEEGYESPKNQGKNKITPCYLDTRSGFLYMRDDSCANKPGFRKLYYCNYSLKSRPEVITFPTCPHCRHSLTNMELTSFSTRGNQSFYNLIKTQFEVQPPVEGKDKDLDRFPNQGRKVLLFSDSRQRAAKLARDMSEASDTAAARQLFVLAINYMEKATTEQTMNNIYDYFCLVAGQKHVHIFHNADHEKFEQDCKDTLSNLRRCERRKREYSPKLTMDNAPTQMKEAFLKMYVAGYNTLYESALSWIEPTDEMLLDCVDELAEHGIEIDEETFMEVFNAWIMNSNDTYMALGHTIPDEIRYDVRSYFGGYGFPIDWKFSTVIKKIMNWENESLDMLVWQNVLRSMFLDYGQTNKDRLYIDLTRVKPRFDNQHIWYKCEQCSEITPYKLIKNCPSCGSEKIHQMSSEEYDSFEFWRSPIQNALDGKKINVIDTEEHTAQLSHKDQRDELWSQTEKYELQFQDLITENETPVDILSSTTTMEVGIDIGSLVAVGLRNIPPMRENYQQRAGRAGRRGSSLSTIVTFCENGPHDTLYFNDPVPMFRGDPRRPWIDIKSEKLIERHISIVSLERFLQKTSSSLDMIPAADFLDNYLDTFIDYLKDYTVNESSALLPSVTDFDVINFRKTLENGLYKLKAKRDQHPELFGVTEGGEYGSKCKSLLDALYEEGLIPTYSFPKNVVSTYISDSYGKLKYQVERGLDVAIGEYAPGRSIVVDKQTYQIGGLFYPGSERKKGQASAAARAYIDDPNYTKHILKCNECGWFGLESENEEECPFCGNENLEIDRDMVRPWGFAPRDGKSIPNAQLEEEYTAVNQPLYSTLPSSEDIKSIANFKNIRSASRTNQRIIMINNGSNNNGFMICPDCGAAMPGYNASVLKDVKRPYISKFAKGFCHHTEARNVNLGYDFVTDMLVLEITLDETKVDAKRDSFWLRQAAVSLSEAIRLSACKMLDVEFTELVTGYRYRRNKKGIFIDIYLYDSLSSGAGYAVSIENEIIDLLKNTKELLQGCDCGSACYKCLKHYRNQYLHGSLNRYFALDLLEWAIDGKTKAPLSIKKQKNLIAPIESILRENGCEITMINNELFLTYKNKKKRIVIYPGMWNERNDRDIIYVSDVYLKYAKPYGINRIMESMR